MSWNTERDAFIKNEDTVLIIKVAFERSLTRALMSNDEFDVGLFMIDDLGTEIRIRAERLHDQVARRAIFAKLCKVGVALCAEQV